MSEGFNPKDQRIVVRYLHTQKHDPTDIHKQLVAISGEGAVSYKIVKGWIQDFNEGRIESSESSVNGDGGGIASQDGPIDPALVARLEFLVHVDRRISVDRAAEMSISTSYQAQQIMNHVLGLKRVCERWVPRLWTPEQRNYRVAISQEHFDRYQTEDEMFLTRIVVGDETFSHYYKSDNLQKQSATPQRHHSVGEKYRPTTEPITINFIFFFDMKGILLMHEVAESVIPDAEYYSKVIKEELAPLISRKRKGIKADEILLLHDNTPTHCSTTTQNVLKEIGIETLPHPPASPDLEPHEYWFFPYLKSELRKTTFHNRQGLVTAINHHLNNCTEKTFSNAIRKLPERWSRCVENNGLYIL